MIFHLTIDEATAVLVAAMAVKTQYEIENRELTSDAYLALKSAYEHLDRQLWARDR
jgi:hypothetical protein